MEELPFPASHQRPQAPNGEIRLDQPSSPARQMCIAVFTDNLASYYACLKQGSIKSSLMHQIYGEVLDIVRKKQILFPMRIPEIRNVLVDALSRSGPILTEWELHLLDFSRIEDWEGPL